jgi:hypothetical protein
MERRDRADGPPVDGFGLHEPWPWINKWVAGAALALPLLIVVLDMAYLIWRG